MAAEIIPPEALGWVVGVIVMGVLGVFGFLARNAVSDLKEGITGLGAKMDLMRDTVARGDTRTAVLEARLTTVERELADLRRHVAEGVAR